jgi:hypothetical protein
MFLLPKKQGFFLVTFALHLEKPMLTIRLF